MHRFLKWEHVCFANSMENAELMTRWYNVKLTVEARHWLFAVKVEEFRFKNSALFKRVREIKKLNKNELTQRGCITKKTLEKYF